MLKTVTILGAGSMGAGIGAVLSRHGIRVLSPLAKRSPASVRRAFEAGMVDATPADIGRSDLILSIVPPAQAEHVARDLLPALADAIDKPVYVECNPIAPRVTRRIAAMIEATGCGFVDGGIIGLPPGSGALEPTLYLSGPDLERVSGLADAGLRLGLMAGRPVGAASALKLAYAGISKGLIGLAADMALAAEEAGVADYFVAELAHSQRQLLDGFSRTVPDMLGKSGRWVAEMEAISELSGRGIHSELGRFYGDVSASPMLRERLRGFYAKRG